MAALMSLVGIILAIVEEIPAEFTGYFATLIILMPILNAFCNGLIFYYLFMGRRFIAFNIKITRPIIQAFFEFLLYGITNMPGNSPSIVAIVVSHLITVLWVIIIIQGKTILNIKVMESYPITLRDIVFNLKIFTVAMHLRKILPFAILNTINDAS